MMQKVVPGEGEEQQERRIVKVVDGKRLETVEDDARHSKNYCPRPSHNTRCQSSLPSFSSPSFQLEVEGRTAKIIQHHLKIMKIVSSTANAKRRKPTEQKNHKKNFFLLLCRIFFHFLPVGVVVPPLSIGLNREGVGLKCLNNVESIPNVE